MMIWRRNLFLTAAVLACATVVCAQETPIPQLTPGTDRKPHPPAPDADPEGTDRPPGCRSQSRKRFDEPLQQGQQSLEAI